MENSNDTLGAFPALSGQSLGFMKSQCTGKQSAFSFINGTYSGNGNSYAPSAITGFQFAFGNVRIVPYTKQQLIMIKCVINLDSN
jgi:hypothetical protein